MEHDEVVAHRAAVHARRIAHSPVVPADDGQSRGGDLVGDGFGGLEEVDGVGNAGVGVGFAGIGRVGGEFGGSEMAGIDDEKRRGFGGRLGDADGGRENQLEVRNGENPAVFDLPVTGGNRGNGGEGRLAELELADDLEKLERVGLSEILVQAVQLEARADDLLSTGNDKKRADICSAGNPPETAEPPLWTAVSASRRSLRPSSRRTPARPSTARCCPRSS